MDRLQGPAGNLQLLIEEPESSPVALAVLCHPHPLYGGSLTNKVVHQLARTCVEQGAISIRFNFRGVGESEGSFDHAHGEQDDLQAVVDWARQRWPQTDLWLGGFSFGGSVALQAAAGLQPARLLTVAPAVSLLPGGGELNNLTGIDWLLIQGREDEVVSADSVLAWVDSLALKPRIVLVDGASHFFHGRLNDLRQAVLDAWPNPAI